MAIPGSHNDNSCSSNPEESSQGDNSRTQYISATCVVVTHYSGDVASVVDDHFTRALNFNDKNSKGRFKTVVLLVVIIFLLHEIQLVICFCKRGVTLNL